MGYVTKGNGYMRQQETRPQTLGYGLHDSPVALLAWIYDKMHSWADAYPWTDEEILTWVSVYYFSMGGPTASTRIYYEASAPRLDINVESGLEGLGKKHDEPVPRNYLSLADIMNACAPRQVRFAVTRFKEELILLPWAWSRQIGNVVRETEYDRGGHFAAWEVPQLLAAELKAFLGRDGQAYGAVTGRDGYAGEAAS
jgi:microsomal epoxide hydrolase